VDPVTRAALAARRGDRAGLERFVALTQADVWRLCSHLGGGADPDDLAQETYERALGAIRRYRGEASGRTWLLGIARRVCADHVRRSVRGRRAVQRAYTVVRNDDLAEQIALGHLLAALDEPRRTAFVLTQVIGLPYEEAARVVGCPVGTIRSRVARARADLLAVLDPADERRPTLRPAGVGR
jgi:RNA polymerase sigma-70 factor (ECF subfamily)